MRMPKRSTKIDGQEVPVFITLELLPEQQSFVSK